jgi:tetratricopeptide (TPR) repeat protein
MLNNNLNAWLLNLVWSGKYEKALGVTRESLEISLATKNIWNQGWPRNLQGQIWFEYGEIDKALGEMEESIRLAKEANTPVYVAWFGSTLCRSYVSIGMVQKGLDLYHATRIPNQDIPMTPGRTATLVDYALCEIAAGDLNLAASTLDACHLTNSVWDFAMKMAQCRLAMAHNDLAQAIAIINPVIVDSQKFKLGQCLPEALFMQGQAYLMNGENNAAKGAFEQARFAAEAIGSRRLLWQILAALAEIESDKEKSDAMKAQARETIQFIADHITSDELRSSFLQSENVGVLMA